MIWLRQALHDIGLTQSQAADILGYSHGNIAQALGGFRPATGHLGLRVQILAESSTVAGRRLAAWLAERGMTAGDLMKDMPERLKPKRGSARVVPAKPIRRGDPAIAEPAPGGVMLTMQSLKHFSLTRSPFQADVNEPSDIFLSQEHLFLKEMMSETARAAGFIAVYGEVGSGKSTMRKAVYRDLTDEGVQIVFPMIIDKSRISAQSLIDAIITDTSDEPPKRTLEAKSRQALRLLRNRAANGLRQVLIIEEAHLLNPWALKHLKAIYELEDGYKKLLGIILIGQPELAERLDESRHPDLREVIRRITIARIDGLEAHDVERYLRHKLSRIRGANADRIFSEDSYPAIVRRLTTEDGAGNKLNRAYPLSINNIAAQAMNTAARIGETRVTAEVVMGL